METRERATRQPPETLEELIATHPTFDSVFRSHDGSLTVTQKLTDRGVRKVEVYVNKEGVVTLSAAKLFAGPPEFGSMTIQEDSTHTYTPEQTLVLTQARLGVQFFDAFSKEADPTKSRGRVIDYARDENPDDPVLQEKLRLIHKALGIDTN